MDLDILNTMFNLLNPSTTRSTRIWISAFIANKPSKRCKRFGFMGVKDATDFVSSKSINKSPLPSKSRSISLNDQDLISIDDSSKVLLVKLKEVDSMSNMYKIHRNEGFVELKIHHIRGLWIWIQFSTSSSCLAFQDNECMKRLSQTFKPITPSFKVDEHMIWIEISGLLLCAWGSNAFKKIACMFGKFMFFEVEQSSAICTGRVCVATKSHQFVSEKVEAVIHDVNSEDDLDNISHDLNEENEHIDVNFADVCKSDKKVDEKTT
ncbi:hypothetical protein Tco_0640391 [Tanacetum coccineum]